MAYEQITIEVSDRVLVVTLNRPERLNAWTPTMGDELIDAFDRADADDEVRAVIVTGAAAAIAPGPIWPGAARPSIVPTPQAASFRGATEGAASRCGCSIAPSR